MFKYIVAVFMLAGLMATQPGTAVAEDSKAAVMKMEVKKTKRPMTEKQKKNVETMRACGAEWRAAKAAGTVKGQKWRDYLKECRKRKKEA